MCVLRSRYQVLGFSQPLHFTLGKPELVPKRYTAALDNTVSTSLHPPGPSCVPRWKIFGSCCLKIKQQGRNIFHRGTCRRAIWTGLTFLNFTKFMMNYQNLLYLRNRTLEVTRETLVKIGQNIPMFVARESLSLQNIILTSGVSESFYPQRLYPLYLNYLKKNTKVLFSITWRTLRACLHPDLDFTS